MLLVSQSVPEWVLALAWQWVKESVKQSALALVQRWEMVSG